MLALGFALSLMNKYSYFQRLVKRLKKESAKLAVAALLTGGFSLSVSAQSGSGAGIPAIDPQISKALASCGFKVLTGAPNP